MKFYDWDATFSRLTGTNGEFTMVIGARSIGKTYGLRKKVISYCIKHGKRYCELVRTESELKGDDSIISGYFDKLQEKGEFCDYVFMTKGRSAYYAPKPIDDEKPDWKLLIYFIPLSLFQKYKKRTYADVRFVIFDEAVIDRKSPYSRYLPNEYALLSEMLSTIARENPDTPTQLNTFLLGNACDFALCPYFQHLEINEPPKFGYNWYRHKTVLLDYVAPDNAAEFRANTIVGRMLDGYADAATMFDNEFAGADDDFIERKTPAARYQFGIAYKNVRFGVWLDLSQGLMYINRTIPANHDNSVWALSTSDNKIDYQMARRSEPHLKKVISLYYVDALRYDSPATRELFLSVLNFFGIR